MIQNHINLFTESNQNTSGKIRSTLNDIKDKVEELKPEICSNDLLRSKVEIALCEDYDI